MTTTTPRTTTLINLWAGSGCGKSTTAAEVFVCMKQAVQAGRYEDETAARRVDELCEAHLRMHANRPFHFVRNAADVLVAVAL